MPTRHCSQCGRATPATLFPIKRSVSIASTRMPVAEIKARQLMALQIDPPLFLQRRSTDEYQPLPHSEIDQRVVERARRALLDASSATNRHPQVLASGRANTAAGLRALNAEWGDTFYDVPVEAVESDEGAGAAFDGPERVIDVQTHFLAPHAAQSTPQLRDFYDATMPAWWAELEGVDKYDLGTYISKVFLETENSIAVLTSGPGDDPATRHLFNDEMLQTRLLIEQFADSPRLMTHAVVHPELPGELELMESWRDEIHPVGWKVYTPGRMALTPENVDTNFEWVDGWMLDDEEHGFPFMERARELGVRLVCVHKGVSGLTDNGSPRDIGPVARAFPDIDIVVYHSGYEPYSMDPDAPDLVEGPFSENGLGVDRLIRSVQEAGVEPGSNVYAELGTTWFCLIRRPVEAAHVLGKLLQAFGQENVIWGTDSIWYGGAQPLIDAFRAFQIPDWMCEQFGYEKISAQTKARILGLNAAQVYGIDIDELGPALDRDDLSWAKQLQREYLDGRVGAFLR